MKLNLSKKRKSKKTINGQEFYVIPYVSVSAKRFILSKLEEYYSSEQINLVDDVCSFRADLDVLVISSNTDIELSENDKYEDLVESGLIDVVRKSVLNYDEIYQDASFLIQCIKLSKMFPDLESTLTSVPKMLDEMSPEQKERLELVAKAAIANSAGNSILNVVKGDE